MGKSLKMNSQQPLKTNTLVGSKSYRVEKNELGSMETGAIISSGVEDHLPKSDFSPADNLTGYKCGCINNGKSSLDDNELSLSAYLEWKDSVGWNGDKSLCWNCWCSQKTNKTKEKKNGN